MYRTYHIANIGTFDDNATYQQALVFFGGGICSGQVKFAQPNGLFLELGHIVVVQRHVGCQDARDNHAPKFCDAYQVNIVSMREECSHLP